MPGARPNKTHEGTEITLWFLFSITVIILSLSTSSETIWSSHVLKKSRCPVQHDVEGPKCTETTHISLFQGSWDEIKFVCFQWKSYEHPGSNVFPDKL